MLQTSTAIAPPLNQYLFCIIYFWIPAYAGMTEDYRFLPAAITCLTSVFAYPDSLSYQAKTFTRFPQTTRVIESSAIAPSGRPRMSDETSSSSATAKIPSQRLSLAAFVSAAFTSSTLVSRFAIKVMSATEPQMTGTRSEMPSNLPSSDGYAFVTAIAAPVEDWMIFAAAARPSRKPFLPAGPSTSVCVAVYACTVFKTAFSIPTTSSRIAITGEAALVVQEAFEVILQSARDSSLTPISTVLQSLFSPLIGAETMTRLAPAAICCAAPSALAKNPVDSITTSTPSSPHGNFAGSFSERY